jgi:hypothetical protein
MGSQADATNRTAISRRRSRRQLLAGGTGALAAITAEALAKPAPANAVGNPVVLGQGNREASTTTILNARGGQLALKCQGTGAGGGVQGVSKAGRAVEGTTDRGTGVIGSASQDTGNGVGVVGVVATDTFPDLSGIGNMGVYGAGGDAGVMGDNPLGVGFGVYGRSTDINDWHGPAVFGQFIGRGTGVSGVTDTGTGVFGQADSGKGVHGVSRSGTGVFGQADSGKGVYGQHGTTSPPDTIVNQHGVHGVSDSALGFGVRGEHLGIGTGVSGSGQLGGTGVSGTAAGGGPGGTFDSDTGTGVLASSASGKAIWGSAGNVGSAFFGARNGVHGLTDSGTDSGVLGENAGGGPGVQGVSKNGVGVLASGQIALKVNGPAVFSRSGTLTIAAGNTSATRRAALTSASLVLVTAQNDVPGTVIRSAVPDAVLGAFTVNLGGAVSGDVTVAWFIVN